ncbi:hypothetical protein [Serratia sp. (in: enterobacteria)]|uniref:hypothetical protein n=1 Tax=Serratia sp. (in: enterobacteria) TaxID=616 RepID=UPI00398917FB
MKKYSYPYLFGVMILLLVLVFGGVVWHREVYRVTFLNRTAVRYMLVAVLVVALVTSGYLIRRGVIKSKKLVDYIKLFGGVSFVMAFVAIMALVAITYCLPGEASSYTTSYTYAASSRNSCAGANVDDAGLNWNIRVCSPAGNFEFNNKIYVEKRSNALGIVVTYAHTYP